MIEIAGFIFVVIGLAFDFFGVDSHRAALDLDLGAEPGQDLRHELHIAQVRHAMNDARLGRE